MPIAIGRRRARVLLENPTNTSDGDGGYTQAWAKLTPPKIWVLIQPATARALERVAVGSVQANASHLVTGPYHSGVTTKTRVTFESRVLQVTGVAIVDEREAEMVLTCVEVVA